MKPLKIKPCKLCPSKRYANISWCFKHYKERERIKREEKSKQKLLRKQSTKKYQESERKKLNKKCWKLQSERVRKNGADRYGFNECYTCLIKLPWKELNAGHYRHNKLDYDERNLKPQCVRCNKYYSGQLNKYALRLVKENGIDWLEQLEKDADRHLGYRLEDLQKIYQKLKNPV